MITRVICDYEIIEQLGQGGMGVVYLGKNIETDERVAIKTLHQNLISTDDEWLTRFLREGEALRDLNHPNIVKMLAMCEEENQHFIVMEYLDGGSLEERMVESEGLLTLEEVLDISLQLADAITRAHYLNIIHRDLKPANVLMSTDDRACVTDFGLARTGPSDLSASGAIFGTIGYLSPEVIQGREATKRSDIWSFGVLLVEMLTGQQPFLGDSPSATLMNILSEPPPDLESLRPDIPVQLVDLVYRMLPKEPDQRVSSVRQIGATLEAIGRNEDGGLVAWDLIGDRFKAQDAHDSPRSVTKLPSDLTPFFGRSREIADLTELLTNGEARLATILGPGGIGKTRLAIEVARSIGDRFKHGVAFVPLAELNSTDSLIPAIWEAVNYPPVHADSRTPEDQTIEFFYDKEMLLIFDNCEHLLDGTELAIRLFRTAPGVRILATTRERLNLRGETIYRLDGLEYPDETAHDRALDYAAIQLFIETSRRWRPGFEVNDENLPHIVRICRMVQGLPLGIILAAAWIDALSVEEIAREISDNLDFLASEMRDIPERQRSIRAAFEGSWRRLSAAEQETFMRLAIFRGGFDLEAARAIAETNVRNLLSLTNKSLLWRDPSSGRYNIHRMLRQYAQQELVRNGESAVIQRKHAEYFANLAEKIDQLLRGPDDLPWYGRMREENENLLAALEWALLQENDPVVGGRLFAALGYEWFLTDNVVDGTNWMERSLKYIDMLPSDVQARVYNRSGLIGCVQGNYAKAAAHHAQAVQLFRGVGDEGYLAYALAAQFNMSIAAGMGSLAYPLAEESLYVAYRAEDPYFLTVALGSAATLSRHRGDEAQARKLVLEGIKIAEIFPNYAVNLSALRYGAMMAMRDGEYDLALAKYADAISIARQLDWRARELDTIQNMAYIYFLAGDLDRAVNTFSDSLDHSREINHFSVIAWNLIGIGVTSLIQGNKDRAKTMFKERLSCQPAEELSWQIAICLAGMGNLAWMNGQEKGAAQLLGASESLTERGNYLPFSWFTNEWQQWIDELKPTLHGDYWHQGRVMTGQQAIAYALGQIA
jgi:serine/threonine protein kinase/tetratricopeptide (TPR) repeat protein